MINSFRTILADPPWPERGGGKCKRGADRHYPLMSPREIFQTIWSCSLFRPAEDAHLYLWTTDNYLPAAIELMRLLDFRYIRTLPWIKFNNEAFELMANFLDCQDMLKIGLGQYFRGASEILLFGVRGNGMKVCTERRDICNVILGPRGRHSKKPEQAYEKIEARSKGPYLELFARSERPGWVSWGDEMTANSRDDK